MTVQLAIASYISGDVRNSSDAQGNLTLAWEVELLIAGQQTVTFQTLATLAAGNTQTQDVQAITSAIVNDANNFGYILARTALRIEGPTVKGQ